MFSSSYNWDFSVIWEQLPLLWEGLLITLKLTGWSCLFGTLLAIMLAMLLKSRSWYLRVTALIYVECAKAIPLLVALVALHYIVATHLEIRTSAFTNACIAFTISLSGFLTDVLRGGIASIPSGHMEAGLALGLSRRGVLLRIVIPETIRRSLPSMVVMYVTTLKLSTLASAIAVREILYTVRRINRNGQNPFEIYLALAGIFILVIVPLSWAARALERHPWFAISPITKK